MKLKLGIIYGILIWFFVYLITVIFSPLITDNIPYINIVAPIAIITVSGFFGILYIRDINENEVIEGFKIGTIFILMDVICDFVFFVIRKKTNILIDKDTAISYDYSSTIDSNTYNKVKLVFDNDKTKKRDAYIAQSSKNMNKWGVLQLYETLQEGENGKAKADALLKLYNSKTKKLTIKTLGSVKVRAGSMVVVMLSLGDKKLCNYMLVESCKHTFKLNEHTMELHLRGGEFTGE